MDDYLEIDIKKIFKKLLLQWYWILGITLIIGLLTFLHFYLKEDLYESRSKVALIEPRYQARFVSDPSLSDTSLAPQDFKTNIITSNLPMPSEAFINGAVTSPEVIRRLFKEWTYPGKDEISMYKFAENNLQVSLEGRGSIVVLAVKASTPEEAAALANLWAELAVEQINSTYFNINEDMIDYFQQKLEIAEADCDQSGKALVSFAVQDNSELLQIQLDNLTVKANATLQRRMALQSAESDVMGILSYIQSLSPDSTVRQGDLLNFTLIQTRVYGSPFITGQEDSSAQLQIVLDRVHEQLSNSDFTDSLNGWTEVIRSEMSNLDLAYAALGPEISALQSVITEIELERAILETEHNLNESTFRSLKTKLEEVTLNIETSGGNATFLGEVDPVPEALPHNTVRNTLIAIIASFVLVSLLVLVVDWWKADTKTEE